MKPFLLSSIQKTKLKRIIIGKLLLKMVGRKALVDGVKTRIGDGTLFLWIDRAQAVSMAAINRKTKNVGVIGYVYTPKEFRGKGYATTLVKIVSKKILQNGFTYCSLFTDSANPTSNYIYRKIGYEPVAEFTTIIFK